MIWKMATDLTKSEEQDWKSLAKIHLGETAHPDRIRGFSLAREALREGFRAHGHSLPIQEIIIHSFDRILTHTDLTFSLSHSKNVGVALVGEVKKYRGMGIDVENQNRSVKEGVLQRIYNRNDIVIHNLEIWCIKEAAFKAIINSQLLKTPPAFSEIVIKQNTFSLTTHPLEGKWKIENATPFIVACAWIDT